MAGRQWADAGGIFGLRSELLTKPSVRAAIQYDLITRGLSLDQLGSEAFTWYDLMVFARHVQVDPHSALATELHGPAWTIEAQLLATIVDILGIANWQRAGRKSAPKPKRLPRPWEKPKSTSLGKDAIPISSFNDWWESRGAKRRQKRRAARAAAKKPPTS